MIHLKYYKTDDGHASENGSITEGRVPGSSALQESYWDKSGCFTLDNQLT